MKKCSVCLEVKEDSFFNYSSYTKSGLRSQCKACMQQYREENRDYFKEYRSRPENKKRQAKYRREHNGAEKKLIFVRNKTRYLEKEPCEVCQTKKRVQGHHDDYNKPLEVRWLCPAHHREWHQANGPGLNRGEPNEQKSNIHS